MRNDSEAPLARLEDRVRRQDTEQRAGEAVARARVKLILGRDAKSVFFATLALRLAPQAEWEIETAATDGESLAYNPEWFLANSEDAQVTIVAHEVMHCALSHHGRRASRHAARWNAACDLAVNPILKEAGFSMPAHAAMPGKGSYASFPAGLSAEEYYDLLAREQGEGQDVDEPGGQGQGEGKGPGGDDPGGMGAVREPGEGSPAEQQQGKAEWEVAVAQAAQAAKGRGELTGALARFVHELQHPRPDVAEVLRQFVSQSFPSDYSWAKPNRRMLAQGLMRPGLDGEDLGVVVMAVDTSGSIEPETLQKFGSLIEGVLEAYPAVKLVILYHDSAVCGVQEWSPDDGPLRMTPAGGGGTDHRPVFDWVAERPELEVTCLVCLTDLASRFPEYPPNYPVLWATTEPGSKGPFGQTVFIS